MVIKENSYIGQKTSQNFPGSAEMKRVPYTSISKKSIFEILKEALPEGAYPTDRTPKILSFIFILVILIGAAQFPIFGLFSGNTQIAAKLGYPLVFLEFKLYSPTDDPIRIGNMVIDVLIYVFLAYLIDIILNVIAHSKFIKSEEELKGIPKEYKLNKKSLADRATQSIFKK